MEILTLDDIDKAEADKERATRYVVLSHSRDDLLTLSFQSGEEGQIICIENWWSSKMKCMPFSRSFSRVYDAKREKMGRKMRDAVMKVEKYSSYKARPMRSLNAMRMLSNPT